MHAAVACGVAVGTAVLTGALLVGDSMRGSLRQLTLERLGRIDQALVADRFFRVQLADELAARPGFPKEAAAIPAILLDVSVESAGSGPAARANRVHLVGCDARFWALGSGGPSHPPGAREIVINEPLADQLGAKAGDDVLVRLPHLGSIPAESPLGRKSETVRSERLTVSEVIPASGFGRFGLRAGQQAPRNAYVALGGLQDRLDQPGRANAILVSGADESVQDLLAPRLEDYGIHVAKTPRGYVNVTSNRMLLEPAVEKAVLDATGDWSNFAADPSMHRERASAAKLDLSPLSPRVQPALTYLANTIACGSRETPYSTITAVDFAASPPLGPMLGLDGKPVAPLREGEIALNAWAADDLQAKPGDAIRVSFFEPESTHGTVRERVVTLRLAVVVQLAGAAADPDFTPEVPGVTDQLSIGDWNPPFPFDARRVRKKDDDYWKAHRGTPKAFVSLAQGRKLWSSRFGQTTSLRIAEGKGDRSNFAAEDSSRRINRSMAKLDLSPFPTLDPAAMGFIVRPVKAQGLAASAGTTPFEVLFLSFSFFLIVAAAMLVALLFRLGVDRRAAEIGILLAVGWPRRRVTGLLVAEGAAVAAVGSLAGLVFGVGYAALLIAGLHTLWLAAVVTPFLQLYVTWQSLAIGYAAGLVVALTTIAWSARRAGRGRPRRLLAGEVDAGDGLALAGAGRHRRAAIVSWIAAVGAIALALAAARIGDEFQAGAFFGAASLVLTASLALVWTRLASGATGPAVAVGRGNLLRLAVRNAARNPMRSTLTVGLVGSASFLIVAVSAFRIDPAREKPSLDSGNGGFAIVAESDQPIYYDLNTPEGREPLGFSPEDSKALAGTTTMPLRVRSGDDASCLNLYRPQQPRVLGVPRPFLDRGGFAWTSVAEPTGDDRRPAAAIAKDPWLLLERELGPDEDGVPRVPVVLEKNTANYALQLWKGVGQTYDIRDSAGRPLRLVIVGLLGMSLFEGDLLISEQAMLRHFPDESGSRFFLIETKSDEPARVQEVQRILERTLGDFGFTTETTGERLAGFLAVQNTYLSTFQSLGGLGLLLGTFGLAAVQLRSVLERRRELALLRAVGFRRRLLAAMVTLENAILLVAGLACGVVSAAVAVLPHFWSGNASIPWVSLAATLGLVLAVGLLAGLTAVRSALRTPLLAALRGD